MQHPLNHTPQTSNFNGMQFEVLCFMSHNHPSKLSTLIATETETKTAWLMYTSQLLSWKWHMHGNMEIIKFHRCFDFLKCRGRNRFIVGYVQIFRKRQQQIKTNKKFEHQQKKYERPAMM